MAVLKSYRQQGIGKKLFAQILNDLQQQNITLFLHAQIQAVDFYRAFGFTAYGDEYDEAGIPHVTMKL